MSEEGRQAQLLRCRKGRYADKSRRNVWVRSGGMQMDDPFDLQRFVNAQEPVFATVLEELQDGRKRSH